MKRISFIVFLSVALFAGVMGTAFAATVSLIDTAGNSKISVKPSSTFQVDLYLKLSQDDVAQLANNGLVGYTVAVNWDPLVQLTGYTKGPLYTAVDVTDADTSKAPLMPWVGNKINLNGYNFGDPIAQSHVLETFNLHCLAPGDTRLVPQDQIPGISFALADGRYLNVDYQAMSIHQTPIPGALLFMGSGLVGLLGFRRKFRP